MTNFLTKVKKVAQIYRILFRLFWKHQFSSRNYRGYFWGNFLLQHLVTLNERESSLVFVFSKVFFSFFLHAGVKLILELSNPNISLSLSLSLFHSLSLHLRRQLHLLQSFSLSLSLVSTFSLTHFVLASDLHFLSAFSLCHIIYFTCLFYFQSLAQEFVDWATSSSFGQLLRRLGNFYSSRKFELILVNFGHFCLIHHRSIHFLIGLWLHPGTYDHLHGSKPGS